MEKKWTLEVGQDTPHASPTSVGFPVEVIFLTQQAKPGHG